MDRTLAPLLAFTALTLSQTAVAPARAAGLNLTFEAQGQGEVVYAVFDDPKAWTARKPARLSGAAPIAAGKVDLELPPGDYAVMAFLDRNGNRRLDTLPIGLPTEPYGFSNNARGAFGPPAWTAARFRLNGAGATQAIRLR